MVHAIRAIFAANATVGFDDMTPQASLGPVTTSLAMLTGYSIIAVPTGILTAEFNQELMRERTKVTCPHCHKIVHERDPEFCKFCGVALPDNSV